MDVQRTFAGDGGQMSFVAPHPLITRVLSLTGTDQIVPVYPDLIRPWPRAAEPGNVRPDNEMRFSLTETTGLALRQPLAPGRAGAEGCRMRAGARGKRAACAVHRDGGAYVQRDNLTGPCGLAACRPLPNPDERARPGLAIIA